MADPSNVSVEEVRWEYQKQWNSAMERDLREIQKALDNLRARMMWSAGFASAVGAFLGVLLSNLS